MSAFYWLGLMVLFIVVEAVTVNMVSIWFAVGSIAGCIAAYAGARPLTQVTLFVVVAAVSLLIFKKFFGDRLKKAHHSTNADMLVGKDALVTEKIDPVLCTGTVEIQGRLWSAKSDSEIEKGAIVEVLGIEGVKLVVKEKVRVM